MSKTENIKSELAPAKVQLVQGEFLPAQAYEIVTSLIDQKISFHNRESIQQWEKNHDFDQTTLKKRIEQLEVEKTKVAAFITNAKANGKKVKVDGQLNLYAID